MQSSIKHLLKHFALVLKAKLNQLKPFVRFVFQSSTLLHPHIYQIIKGLHIQTFFTLLYASFSCPYNSLPSEVPNFFPNGEFNMAFSNLLKTDLTNKNEVTQGLISMANNIIALIRVIIPLAVQQIRNSVTYACFSEKVDSITMWSHYADYHKGFALGYSNPNLSFDSLNKVSCGLFPVTYDNIRYNANSFIAWTIYNIFGIKMKQPDRLANIKAGLQKSTDWSYENEWRLICTVPLQERAKPDATPITICPNEIYYGSRISKEDKILLHEIALKKKLSEYEMSIDNASSNYRMIIKPATF